jgi:hypothetical protein
MSRIRTDLKPTVKGLKSSTSLTKVKGDSATKLPPVSPRCVSASPRGSVDLKWTLDMVRGYTLHGTEKPKAAGSKNSDGSQMNRDYEVCIRMQLMQVCGLILLLWLLYS